MMRLVEIFPTSFTKRGRNRGPALGFMCRAARGVSGASLILLLHSVPAFAQSYEDGLRAHRSGSVERAAEIWQKLADDGDVVSQHSLGRLYAHGEGPIKRDYAVAARLFRQSAAQGYPQAQNDLAVLYALGHGVPKDQSRAAELWAESAQSGVPMAQYNLGLIYFQGRGVDKDPKEAAIWITRAAITGLANAQFALGHMNRLGIAMPQDEARALAWYKLAADQGHAEADKQAEELVADGVEPIALKIAAAAPGGSADIAAAAPAAPAAPAALDDAAIGDGEPAIAAAADNDKAAEPAPGAFMVWIGSMGSRDGAERLWREISAKHAKALAGTGPLIVEVDLGDRGTFYRLHAQPLASRAAAKSVCTRLRADEPDAFCRVVSG